MATHDLEGREYARLSQLKEGDEIELDGDFTCRKAGKAVVRKDNDGQLYFCCDEGGHDISSQLSDDDLDHLIGIYPIR